MNDKRAKTIASLAKDLAARHPIDAAHPVDLRIEAVAEMLRNAGEALKPASRSARTVLAALAKIESLASLPEASLQRTWLALRGLDLEAGNMLGGSAAIDPIVQAFATAGSLVPTLDSKERVSGVIGDMDGREAGTLAARARIASLSPFMIENSAGPLFTEGGSSLNPEQLLKGVDALEKRIAPNAQVVKTVSAVVPLEYDPAAPIDADTVEGDDLFTNYRPARMSIKNAQAHPDLLVESAALASVVPPEPFYRPHLDSSLVDRAVLTDVQLETIVYAGQAHSEYLASNPADANGAPPRQGFLVGHGTGVGKGRIGAGIIMDNWNQGRRHAVWFIERTRHFNTAIRDWVALGGRASDLINLAEFGAGEQLPNREGILVVTYATGRNEKRLEQIIDWVGLNSEDVILFDEAHNMRNAEVENNGWQSRKQSQQGMAGVKLQNTLPNARVTYMSATGASDIASMGYAVRLGLWGRGTAFPTAESFFTEMKAGGINALELVARDLKALGLYFATNLSLEGTVYERLEYRLTDEERQIQDRLSDAWSKVNISLQKAMLTTGLHALRPGSTTTQAKTKKLGGRERAAHIAQFGMAKSRFFQALLSSFKARPIIEAIRKDMADGHAAVVQMTNTYEANVNRAIENNKGGDLSTVEATPKDIIIEYILKQFPVQKFQVKSMGSKTVFLEPMLDTSGNPVLCPQAVQERDDLIREIDLMKMPEGPLEQLFDAFGPEQIAEITGRRRRLVPGAVSGERKLEDRTPAQVTEDIRLFNADVKRILVFSASGGSGESYHADRRIKNQRLRRHYLLQPGWRADLAIQGLGRTNRSNQCQKPVYILVTTDLWADRRMLSTVASGMQGLGAITRGQRHAATQDLFTQEDNLESGLAETAWLQFLQDIDSGNVPNLSLATFEKETGIPLTDFGGRRLIKDPPALRRFLNAMSGMTCDRQDAFGYNFKQRLDEVGLDAIRNDTFDRGIETLNPDSLIKLEDTVIFHEPKTGAATRLLKMLRIDPVDPVDFGTASRHAIRSGNARFVRSALTNRVACLVFPRTNEKAEDDDVITHISPNGIKARKRKDVIAERWQIIGSQDARELWDAELSQASGDSETVFYVVTGCLLPLWDKLPKASETRRVIVYQMETDEGERILGRVLPEDWAAHFVTRVNAVSGNSNIDSDDALVAIEKGETATLANGWVVGGRVNRLSGDVKVEIGLDENEIDRYRQELEKDGVIFIDSRWAIRLYLPDDPTERRTTWRAVTKYRPVVTLTSFKS